MKKRIFTTNQHQPTRTRERIHNKSSRGLFDSQLIILGTVLAIVFASCKLGGPLPLPSYTIVYHANGGGGEMGNSTHIYGASRNLNANAFTRAGFTFTGWAETETGEVKFADRQSVINLTKENGTVIKLYAKWRGNTFTVVYIANAEDGTGTMEPSVFTGGEEQNLRVNTFTRDGFAFAGWARTPDSEDVELTNGQSISGLYAEDGETITLYAVWGVNIYTVAYNANGGEGTMQPSVFTLGEWHYLPLNTFTRTGYTFAGWGYNWGDYAPWADGARVMNVMSAEPGTTVTLVAKWRLNTYTVAYDSNGGSGEMESSTHTYSTAQNLSANAFTRNGYAFLGWSLTAGEEVEFEDEASVLNLTTVADATVTLYAQWIALFTVTFNANGGTLDPKTENPVTVRQGGTVGEPAAVKDGYFVVGWYTEETFDTKWDFAEDTVTNNITLYARWSNAYFVTYNANGGIGEMTETEHKIGEQVTLPIRAFTRAAHTFAGWALSADAETALYSDGQTISGLSTTAGEIVTLYAVWEEIVVVVPNPGDTLTAKLDWLNANAESDVVYVVEVTNDETIAPRTINPRTGRSNLTIRLRGMSMTRTIYLSSNGSLFTIRNGVTLILDNNITLLGRSGNTYALVRVDSGGTFEMNSGSAITGNTINNISFSSSVASFRTSAVDVSGTFIMNGGTISGNTLSASAEPGGGTLSGCAVVVSGTFTMNGGTISDNRTTVSSSISVDPSAYGGGVRVGGGTFTMNGGTIRGNTVSAVHTNTNPGNDASAYGGGVHINTGTFTMTGGTISNNTVTARSTNGRGASRCYGGGVYVGTGTSFTMTGGIISGNTISSTGTASGSYAYSYGGGVYARGAFTITGSGTISGNTASVSAQYYESYGGDVYVEGKF